MSDNISNIQVNDAQEVKVEVAKNHVSNNYTYNCCIRRKPNLTAIPGQDPNEAVWKLGAALTASGLNLKGITGDLERKYMPSIVQLNPNDNGFKNAVDDYWANISKLIPPDEPYKQDFEQGVRLTIKFKITGAKSNEAYKSKTTIEEKIEYLNKLLTSKYNTVEGESFYLAELEEDSISDFLLLNFAIKSSKVANNIKDVNKSPKILFYLYEKESAIKAAMSFIELKDKATELFQSIREDNDKLTSILYGFNKFPGDYPTILDKVVAIDGLYTKNENSIKLFLDLAQDKNYKIRLLINDALFKNKLHKLPNTESIMYNDKVIGSNMNDAIHYLLNDETGQQIKTSLEQEVKV
jgi:hypothetical protein